MLPIREPCLRKVLSRIEVFKLTEREHLYLGTDLGVELANILFACNNVGSLLKCLMN